MSRVSTFSRVGTGVFLAHIALGALAVILSSVIGKEQWWALAPFCFTSIGLHGYLVFRCLRAEPTSILYETGMFMAVSSAVYFAFGPLLYLFGPADAIRRSRLEYRIDAVQAVWLTGVNFIGVGLAGVIVAWARLRTVITVAERAGARWARVSPTLVFLVFAGLGLIAKYVLLVPYQLGLTSSIPSAGVSQLAQLVVIALLIGWAYRRTGPWWMLPTAIVILVLEIVTGILMFNKTASLLAVLGSGLGDYLSERNLRRMVVVVACSVALYLFISPLASYGRTELVLRGGGIGYAPATATLGERLGIVEDYLDGKPGRSNVHDSGDWWRRLNYLPTEQAAVELRRAGRGGDDFARLPWLLVPRVLYPTKPVITVTGLDLTEKITGARNSFSAVGVFIDGYYNLGWLGFLITSVTYGIVLRFFAAMSEPIVRHRALVMYPVVFSGLYTGLRADGGWLADVVAPMLFGAIALFLFRVFAGKRTAPAA